MKILIYHPDQVGEYYRILEGRCGDAELRVASTPAEASEMIAEADILFTKFTFPTHLLGLAKNLRWIQTMGAGVEAFTLSEDVPPGVMLSRITADFGQRIAEYVVAYLLFLTQDVRRVVLGQIERRWDFFCPDLLEGKVAGVAGLGNIGLTVARKLKALDLTVVGLDDQLVSDASVTRQYTGARIHDFLEGLDFLILCLPLTTETRGMFGTPEFRAMKRSAYVVNVARGPIIDERSLAEAVKVGDIAGAILDVFDEEPLPPENELWTLPGITITPHLSGPSTPQDMCDAFLENLDRFRAGKPLLKQVDLERGF